MIYYIIMLLAFKVAAVASASHDYDWSLKRPTAVLRTHFLTFAVSNVPSVMPTGGFTRSIQIIITGEW